MDEHNSIWFLVTEIVLGVIGSTLNFLILLIHFKITQKSLPDFFMVLMCVYNLLITISIIPLSIYCATSDDVINTGNDLFESLTTSNCFGYGLSLLVLSVTRYIKTFRPKVDVLPNSQKALLVVGLLAVGMFCLQCGVLKFQKISYILLVIICIVVFVAMTLTIPIYIIVSHHLLKMIKEWEQLRRNGESSIKRQISAPGCFKNTVFPTNAEQSNSNDRPKERRETFVRQDTNSHINFIDMSYTNRVTDFNNTENDNENDNNERRFYLSSCKKSAKATYIFFCLTISFFIFQSMFWIICFLKPVWMTINISNKVFLDIRLISASIDPILYIIMNSTYRQKLKELIKRS